jgi:hypothetical protein
MMRFRISRRSAGVVSPNVSNAFRAALTALSTSAAVPSEITATWSSFAGFVTGKSFGVAGATHFPSM